MRTTSLTPLACIAHYRRVGALGGRAWIWHRASMSVGHVHVLDSAGFDFFSLGPLKIVVVLLVVRQSQKGTHPAANMTVFSKDQRAVTSCLKIGWPIGFLLGLQERRFRNTRISKIHDACTGLATLLHGFECLCSKPPIDYPLVAVSGRTRCVHKRCPRSNEECPSPAVWILVI